MSYNIPSDGCFSVPLANINSLCRICLQPQLDDEDSGSIAFKNSTSLIALCFAVHITEDRRIPTKICLECRRKLDFIREFRKLIQQSEEHWLLYISQYGAPYQSVVEKIAPANISSQCELATHEGQAVDSTKEVVSAIITSSPQIKTTGFPRHECLVCQKIFPSSQMRLKHLIAKHDVRNNQNVHKPHQCDQCDKAYTTLANLTTHSAVHTGNKPFKCDICSRSFIKRASLESHLTIHTGERKHICGTCSRGFTSASILQQHEKTHSKGRTHQCSVCNRAFHTSNDLRVHIRTHTGERPYLCATCGRGFLRVTHLNIHIRTHSGEKPYACNSCSKSFSQSGDLKAHIRTHTGEKPYGCKICDKSFNQSSGLTAHIKSHTGERNAVCEVCHKSFTQSSSLVRHSKSHLPNIIDTVH